MNFDFDDTEACHLSEIYDGADGYYDDFEPYSTAEKRAYIAAKECRFKKEDIGKFVVVQIPRLRKKTVKRLYLVDRSKTKRFWWSHDAVYAMVFNNKSAAEFQAGKYKHNDIKVVEITKNMVR